MRDDHVAAWVRHDLAPVLDLLSRLLRDVAEQTEQAAVGLHGRIEAVDEAALDLARTGTGDDLARQELLVRTGLLAGELQHQDITRQAIGTITAALDDVRDDVRAVGRYLEGRTDELPAAGGRLERLSGGYVMHRQRAVHDGLPAGAAAGATVEFF